MLALLRRPWWVVLAALAAAVGVVALAQAAIPDGSGTIHGCYRNNNGSLRVVDAAGSCSNSETPLSWSQTGPQGPQGPQGEQGVPGEQGLPGSDADVHAYHVEAFTEDIYSGVVAFVGGLLAGEYIIWATAVVTQDFDSIGMTCSLHVNNGPSILAVGGTANYSDGHDGFGQVDMIKPVTIPVDESTLFFTCGSADSGKDVRARITALKVGGVN
jgi:hypothetical protein